jgi:hypothetical protein
LEYTFGVNSGKMYPALEHPGGIQRQLLTDLTIQTDYKIVRPVIIVKIFCPIVNFFKLPGSPGPCVACKASICPGSFEGKTLRPRLLPCSPFPLCFSSCHHPSGLPVRQVFKSLMINIYLGRTTLQLVRLATRQISAWSLPG